MPSGVGDWSPLVVGGLGSSSNISLLAPNCLSILFGKIWVNQVFLPGALCAKWHICVCYTLVWKHKCYIWKLLIAAGKAMCHTYDSHLGEYINLLCCRCRRRGKRTQVFSKSRHCSADGVWGNLLIYWMELNKAAQWNVIQPYAFSDTPVINL